MHAKEHQALTFLRHESGKCLKPVWNIQKKCVHKGGTRCSDSMFQPQRRRLASLHFNSRIAEKRTNFEGALGQLTSYCDFITFPEQISH